MIRETYRGVIYGPDRASLHEAALLDAAIWFVCPVGSCELVSAQGTRTTEQDPKRAYMFTFSARRAEDSWT